MHKTYAYFLPPSGHRTPISPLYFLLWRQRTKLLEVLNNCHPNKILIWSIPVHYFAKTERWDSGTLQNAQKPDPCTKVTTPELSVCMVCQKTSFLGFPVLFLSRVNADLGTCNLFLNGTWEKDSGLLQTKAPSSTWRLHKTWRVTSPWSKIERRCSPSGQKCH